MHRGFGDCAIQLCNAYKSDRCLRRQVPQNCRQPGCEDIRKALLYVRAFSTKLIPECLCMRRRIVGKSLVACLAALQSI